MTGIPGEPHCSWRRKETTITIDETLGPRLTDYHHGSLISTASYRGVQSVTVDIPWYSIADWCHLHGDVITVLGEM